MYYWVEIEKERVSPVTMNITTALRWAEETGGALESSPIEDDIPGTQVNPDTGEYV